MRRPGDGGRWNGTEDARRMLLRQTIVGGFGRVDLETDVADAHHPMARQGAPSSATTTCKRPADLEQIHERTRAKQDADVVKLAVKAQKPTDSLRVLDLMAKPAKPTVAVAMGDMGFARVLGARYGAPFTYAAFNKERGIAPGLPSLAELQQVYSYDKIDAHTQVFGVLGIPVAHSRIGPLMLTTGRSARRSLNMIYLPFRVGQTRRADLPQGVRRHPDAGLQCDRSRTEEAAAAAAKYQDDAVVET